MDRASVLVVDDDQVIRELLGTYLEKHGYSVALASSVMDAKAALSNQSFDIIVLDVMLPDELGTELAAQLRALGSTTAILMLSAVDTSRDRIVGFKSGADDYMPKPFEPEELLIRMRKLLNIRKRFVSEECK